MIQVRNQVFVLVVQGTLSKNKPQDQMPSIAVSTHKNGLHSDNPYESQASSGSSTSTFSSESEGRSDSFIDWSLASDNRDLFHFIEEQTQLTHASAIKVIPESTRNIITKFSKLVLKISDTLSKQDNAVDRLTLFLSNLVAIDPVCVSASDRKLLLDEENIKALETNCKSAAQILKALSGYYSWFNYQLIKDIAKVLCEDSKEVKDELKKYKERFKKYCEKRLSGYFPDETHTCGQDTGFHVFKIDEKWETMTICQLKPVIKIIRRVLKLRKVALCLRSAKNGCVELTYDIPGHLVDVLFPLSKGQVESLKRNGIRFCENNKYFSHSGK